jgi:hypothetical protein
MARISTLAVVAGALAALALAADSASAGSNTVHITVPAVPTGSGHTQWTEQSGFGHGISNTGQPDGGGATKDQCQRILTRDN